MFNDLLITKKKKKILAFLSIMRYTKIIDFLLLFYAARHSLDESSIIQGFFVCYFMELCSVRDRMIAADRMEPLWFAAAER